MRKLCKEIACFWRSLGRRNQRIMDHNYFEKEYTIHYYETGSRQELKITSLMKYFEEAALLQSEERKVGLDYYRENQVVWMLHKWDITVHNYPVFGQRILVRTLPVSMAGFLGYRRFWVFDGAGDPLVSATSAWIFVNTSNKRPIRVTQDMKQAYRNEDRPENKLEMAEIPALQKTDFSREFYVRQADIDINRHVNNVRYVDWALEALPPEILQENRLENIRIVFKKETTYGQKIQSQAEIRDVKEGKCSLHNILDEQGNEACALSLKWQPFVPA